MRFLLIGCNGKMGKRVSLIAKDFGDEISCGVDKNATQNEFPVYQNINDVKEDYDGIVDFSSASSHSDFIKKAIEKNIPYGLFSTIISPSDQEIIFKAGKKIAILVCKNASLGINLMYKIIKECILELPNDCDCAVSEYHHKQKLDTPSGTAKEIEKLLIDGNINFTTNCFRVGQEKGYHKVEFFFGDEVLTISHRAYSRDIFAKGAISAMHKLALQSPGVYKELN